MNPSINDIIETTRTYYGIDRETFVGPFRGRRVARPRQVAMYLCRKKTTRSYPEIGRMIGHRDHTTILHGERRIAALIATGDKRTIRATSIIQAHIDISLLISEAVAAHEDEMRPVPLPKPVRRFSVHVPIAANLNLTGREIDALNAVEAGMRTRARLASGLKVTRARTGDIIRSLIDKGALERERLGVYRVSPQAAFAMEAA